MFCEIFRQIEREYLSGGWLEERSALKAQLKSRPIVLYGLGFFGGVIVKNFKQQGMEVECFCDSKKRGIDTETRLPVISPQELMDDHADSNAIIAVANPNNEKSVYDTLISLGFDRSHIFLFKDAYQFIRQSRVERVSLTLDEFKRHLDGYARTYGIFSDDISRSVVVEIVRSYLFNSLFSYEPPEESYFPESFRFSEKEIFIDGGLYTGDTTEAFIRRTGGKYDRIIGFDIDKTNLAVAYKNLAGAPHVEIVEKGLWNSSAVKGAELGIMAGSNINDSATEQVELTSLDEIFADVPPAKYPSFIKLDVEGSEKEALLGAKKIIGAAAPKLAVCAYHKPEDVYVLPEVIKSLNPDYKFFLRHYSPYIWDTVLYAHQEKKEG